MIDATSMHRYTDVTERSGAGHPGVHARPPAAESRAARRAAHAAELARGCRADHHHRGPRRARGAAASSTSPAPTACVSVDNPRYLAFIPAAPTESATLFDLVVGASSIYGGSWLEGAGAVYAENQALRWIADLAGMPEQAGGCFVSGGTIGNLSALVAARYTYLAERGGERRRRLKIAATGEAHSSIVVRRSGDGRRRAAGRAPTSAAG